MNYLVCGYPSWSKNIFKQVIRHYEGNWLLIAKKKDLTRAKLDKIKPKYIFFLHWSWLVPKEITDNFNCVCFHMTDLPYGRGGGPLQNLIIRGKKSSQLTALKMEQGLDTGPVYLKKPISLEGRAQEIYQRANLLASEMIKEIIAKNPKPMPQQGKVVVFKRRTKEQSEIKDIKNLEKLYDFIRMLDADGYPRAFLEKDGFLFKFEKAKLLKGEIRAKVMIEKIKKS
ncbi:methionyl-tRNA formyltransferase [Candidatus Gribaldobacteria bacterium]|nr:methionyl-tRNA formyltransferase [Candidatus Gribaldobacteria bacterium]